ncbi:MAG: hypothetical protein FWE61_04990 [Micrococcales bacterium]|nr:hypothetical protein [Micrococcales bacterium]
MGTTASRPALAVLIAVALAGCATYGTAEPSPTLYTASPADEPWTDEEQQTLFACVSDKLGYTLTEEYFNAPPATGAEEEWEAQRMGRAYYQCIFENYPDSVADHPAREMMYLMAYALDVNHNPVMDDPLAPWPGK